MAIPVVHLKRDEMLNCLARFDDLRIIEGGLPDADLPGYERSFRTVLGFVPPEDEDGARVSPVPSSMRSHLAHINTGYGLAYVSCEVGQGVMKHAHDTVETFVPMNGRWRMVWDDENGEDYVDVGPLDVFSFPAGVMRRFYCLEVPEGQERATVMGLVSGEQPAAEYAPECIEELIKAGRLQAAE